ncbi:hypothetical protein, conserved [Eimeria praecox]|uniref:Uncharacterized protein n=1 Tax=Eimeria praecox TaxID=51316 RepID=U6G199_9EIME|nr:hypothetical protein, conserved [Eimeria praecox]
MSGEQRVRVRALLLFAALAAASPAYAAATSPPSPPYPVPREFDVGGRHPRDPRSYGGGGGVGQASGYGVSRTPPIGAWGEREGLDEGLHAVQAEMEGGGVGEGEKEGDMTDRMGASSVSSSRRRGLSSSKERLQEYVERGWGGAPQQPRKAGNNRWGEVGPQRGDTAGGEAWGKALKSAGKSIRNLSKHVYQRSEDYWREPKRRRAIVYFAAVAAMTLVLAYGEHCTRVRSAEGHQLREREEFMKEIEREMVLEGESIKKSLAEARALKTAQDITAKELAEEEESIRIRRDNLRKRAAALQEEQLLLSVRKAKTQLASQPDWDDVAGGESREAVLNRLREIREEANRQYWLDDKARKEAGEALTAMALLETQTPRRKRMDTENGGLTG